MTSEEQSKKPHTDDVSPPISEQCFWLVEVNFPHGTTNQNYYPDLGSEMSAVWHWRAWAATFLSNARQPEVNFISFLMPWRHHICMVKWLYSYRDDYLAKGLFNHGRRVQKVHFRLTCVFLRSFLSCRFTGKLVVASQIRLFSQTQSVQEKNTASITSINQSIPIL